LVDKVILRNLILFKSAAVSHSVKLWGEKIEISCANDEDLCDNNLNPGLLAILAWDRANGQEASIRG
jgi:hypothetical protein